jgi:hypothetical protein
MLYPPHHITSHQYSILNYLTKSAFSEGGKTACVFLCIYAPSVKCQKLNFCRDNKFVYLYVISKLIIILRMETVHFSDYFMSLEGLHCFYYILFIFHKQVGR